MAKIVIGQRTNNQNSPMGCWVAAPGGNAETGAGRMILDSDLDHLKLWASGEQVVNGEYEDDIQVYYYDPVTINFPALPYVPLAFVSVIGVNSPRPISFPPGINYHQVAGSNILSSVNYRSVGVRVTASQLMIGNYSVTGNPIGFEMWGDWSNQARIRWFVFANRREQLPTGPLSNPERVLIEGGNNPKFRVSRPGYSVQSSDLSHFLLREDRPTLRPALTGSIAVSGQSNTNVSLPGYASAPFVVLKRSDNRPPAFDSYFASLNGAHTTMTIHNTRGSGTISYAVYEPNP